MEYFPAGMPSLGTYMPSNTLVNLLLPEPLLSTMADASDAQLPQNAPIPATALPRDRLSQLPNDLLDTIYSLVFQFEDGPWTLHVKKRLGS